MAYDFVPASSQRIIINKGTSAIDLSQISYSFHYQKDSMTGTYREILWSGGHWASDYHSFIQHDTSNYMAFVANWTGAEARWSIANPSDSTWTNDVWTYDFGSSANDPVAYRNGSSVTVTERVTPSGSADYAKDVANLAIGSYSDGSGEYWDGKIAELAIWNRILTAAEAAILGDGYSPLFIPNGLVFYAPMIRNVQDLKSGNTGTITGATVANHPRIIYPSAQELRRFKPSAAIATSIKDLIMAGMIPFAR